MNLVRTMSCKKNFWSNTTIEKKWILFGAKIGTATIKGKVMYGVIAEWSALVTDEYVEVVRSTRHMITTSELMMWHNSESTVSIEFEGGG